MLLFGLILSLAGQSEKKLFIGIQPDITREIKNNEEKVFSVNVFPLVVQYYAMEEISLRISPIVNLQSDINSFSNLGAQFAMPLYLFPNRENLLRGLFTAPLVGISRNVATASNEITCAVEPGYSWILPGGFSMNLGAQLGATYFTADDVNQGWRNHTGIKFSLGYTFLGAKD
jgi:hypothetical protein